MLHDFKCDLSNYICNYIRGGEIFSMPPLLVLTYAVDFSIDEDGGRKYLLNMKSVFKP